MSLVISLTCALLATLLQQWARRYLKVTQPRLSLNKRARIRAFFAEGVEKCLLPLAVEILPTLLHISLFLFFAGLIVFLSNVNLTIFKLVLSWVGVCMALYGCVTLMPLFRHDSPYYTPLSSSVWSIAAGMAFIVTAVCWWLLEPTARWRRRRWWLERSPVRYNKMLRQGMQKRAEETALNSSSKIVSRAFMWTFDCLDEDHELERFFSGLPGFRSSKVVNDPLADLTVEQKWRLSNALIGLMDRTFSSEVLSAPVKERRALVCTRAIDPEHIGYHFMQNVLDLSLSRYRSPLATKIVQIVKGWRIDRNEDAFLWAQAMISTIVASVQPRDDSWYILASNELGLPEADLRDYAAHGDSLSLAVLLHVARQQFVHYGKSSWPFHNFRSVLAAVSKFDVQDTSPVLQNEFCALWNHIVLKVENENDPFMAIYILGPIRNLYSALHQDANSALARFSASTGDDDNIISELSSYPVCTIHGHHQDSRAHIHDDNAPTTSVRTASHNHDNTAPFLSHSPDTHSASSKAPLRVDESMTDVPLLDHSVSPAQTTPASRGVPSISPNLVATLVMHEGIDAPQRTMEVSTQESAASPPPSKSQPSTSPPDVVTVEHTSVNHTASGDLNTRPSASLPPDLDHVLPTGPLLPSESALTVSDHAFPLPESDSSKLAPTARTPSRSRLSSAPRRDAIAEEEPSAKVVLRHENKDDIPHTSLAIHEDTMATADIPSRSPSPQPTDVVIPAGLPRNSLDAEHTGDPSLRGQ